MNLVRSRLSIGSFIGQRCRQVTQTWSHRGMCNKPQEAKAEPPPPPAAPAQDPGVSFRVPGFRPTNTEKKILVWSGRFKSEDQIPEQVSFEMLDAARNKIRLKICYLMVVGTIIGCIVTVIMGKRAARSGQSLMLQNLEKKAQLVEEARREREAAAAALSAKAQ